MSQIKTQAERLTRIETLLEALPKIESKLEAIRNDIDKDTAELAALKNKGAGILVGVGLIGGGFGAVMSKMFSSIIN